MLTVDMALAPPQHMTCVASSCSMVPLVHPTLYINFTSLLFMLIHVVSHKLGVCCRYTCILYDSENLGFSHICIFLQPCNLFHSAILLIFHIAHEGRDYSLHAYCNYKNKTFIYNVIHTITSIVLFNKSEHFNQILCVVLLTRLDLTRWPAISSGHDMANKHYYYHHNYLFQAPHYTTKRPTISFKGQMSMRQH